MFTLLSSEGDLVGRFFGGGLTMTEGNAVRLACGSVLVGGMLSVCGSKTGGYRPCGCIKRLTRVL